nr:HAD family hydrolase [uncultured Ruminococcus sp.]
MEIKLLALDLDGTVLRTDNTLAPEVKDSIKQAIDGGIEVAVASGRPFSSMPKDVLAIDGISWVVASNGAAIYKNGTRQNTAAQRLMSATCAARAAAAPICAAISAATAKTSTALNLSAPTRLCARAFGVCSSVSFQMFTSPRRRRTSSS